MARKSRKNLPKIGITCMVALYIRTALYIRLSVEDNHKRGNSIETQQMVLEQYLTEKPEFLVHEIYIDNGCTGTNFLRPAFQRMLADIEDGKVQCVLVKDLSRLGRNSIDTGYYIERYFPAHKVRFISIADQFDSDEQDNLHGGIMLPLKNMINEAYSMDIGRKIKAQLRQEMKDGGYVGGRAPYGYRKDPKDCHKLLVDDEAAAVVRQIFVWASEAVGINEIVKRLNAADIPTPSHYKQQQGVLAHPNLMGSGLWQTRTIAKMLDTEIYTGDMVQGKTKTVDHRQMPADPDNLIIVTGTHEPIVSRETYEVVRTLRVRVAMESRQRKVQSYSPNIFKGKVYCAHCGGSLHRQRSRRKTMPDVYVYHCLTNSRKKKGACQGVMITETALIPLVKELLKTKLAATLEAYVEDLCGEAEQTRWQDEMSGRLVQCRELSLKCHQYTHTLYENLAKGIINDDEYRMLKARSDADLSAAMNEVSALEKGIAALKGQMARYKELCRAMKDLNRSRSLSASLVEFLVERIEISHDHRVMLTATFENEQQQVGEVWRRCVTR